MEDLAVGGMHLSEYDSNGALELDGFSEFDDEYASALTEWEERGGLNLRHPSRRNRDNF